jgi:hypothetical protein
MLVCKPAVVLLKSVSPTVPSPIYVCKNAKKNLTDFYKNYTRTEKFYTKTADPFNFG